jgi:hypothetical protein
MARNKRGLRCCNVVDNGNIVLQASTADAE